MIKDLLFQNALISLIIQVTLASSSQYNEEILIPTSYPLWSESVSDVGSEIQFEFWSFYNPFQIPQSYPQIEEKLQIDHPKQTLLFLIKSVDDNKVLVFMYATVISEDYVIHTLVVGDTILDVKYKNYNYEGVWIIQTLALYDGYLLLYETVDSINIDYEWIEMEYPNSVEVFVGGTGIINQKYELGIFRGRLSYCFIAFYYRFPEDIYDGTIRWLRMNEEKQTIEFFPDLQIFDGVYLKQFEFDQFGRRFCLFGWVKLYEQDAQTLIQYLIVRLTIFQNYKDEIQYGDEILKITVDLDMTNIQNWGYDIISHHYHMPYPSLLENEATNQKISLRNDLSYLDVMTKWHFISFEYGIDNEQYRSEFKLSFFENEQIIIKSYPIGDRKYNGLFINTKYYAMFGGDYTIYKKLKGQLALFQFVSNYNGNLNQNNYCHYSCKTCDGLFDNNCLSCENRIYLQEQHRCVCPQNYMERDQQCVLYSTKFPFLSFDEVGFDNSNSNCPFGYFYIPAIDQCKKCPQLSQYNLQCIDCLLNSQNWYQRSICTKDAITQRVSELEDAYTEQERSPIDYDVYYIDDAYNVNLLEGVQDYCDYKTQFDNCFYLGVKNLDQFAYGFCKENTYYSKNKCIQLHPQCLAVDRDWKECTKCQNGYYLSNDKLSCSLCPSTCPNCLSLTECQTCLPGFGFYNKQCVKCGQFCQFCQYSIEQETMVCLKCIDNFLYYKSLNAQDCKINQIQNCLIAFETSWTYPSINSLDYTFKPYSGEIVTKCAKCEDNYYFNEESLLCIQGNMKDCQQFVQQANFDEKVCLYGPYNPSKLIFSFSDQCPNIKQNCLLCVIEQYTSYYAAFERIPKKVSYSCLVCQNGYYAQKHTGQCQLCPQDKNCKVCKQYNKYIKDEWKNEIRAYYRAYIDQEFVAHQYSIYGMSPDPSDYEIFCTTCLDGYELHENQCIESCPKSCLECVLQNNKQICVKCPKGLENRTKSLVNNQCITCPKNCVWCKKRDQQELLAINPLFNNDKFLPYTYKCISGTTQYYDEELGIFNDCQYESCIKQIVINLILYCDTQEYYDKLNSISSNQERYRFQQQNMLADNLFTSSSFPQFENQDFYEMANAKQIKKIIIKIWSEKPQYCFVVDKQQITQHFSSNIFTATDVELEIHGKDHTTFHFSQQFSFTNFKKIYISGILLRIEFFPHGPSVLKFKSVFVQSVELVNIQFDQNDDRITFQILIQNATYVYIKNLYLANIFRELYIDYFLKVEQIQSIQNVLIEDINLQNSGFWDLDFFWIDLKNPDYLEINNVNIYSTYFNKAFIKQTAGELRINNIKFYKCTFYSEIENYTPHSIFEVIGLKFFQIYYATFQENLLTQKTILININTYAHLMNINFIGNTLTDQSIFIQNYNIDIFYLLLYEIQFTLNKYQQQTRFVKIAQNGQFNNEIDIKKVSIIGNQIISDSKEPNFDNLENSLIFVEVNMVNVENLNIQRGYGYSDIIIINSQKLRLYQIEIKQYDDFKFRGIHEQLDCFQKSVINQYFYISIRIYDAPEIEFSSLLIQQAQSINYPIIDIQTSVSKSKTSNLITFSDIQFIENLLLMVSNLKKPSILQISSTEQYEIEIKDSKFEKNILHQYQQSGQINSGLLFNIYCQLCTIHLTNVNIKQNIAINSYNSLFYIEAKYLKIQDTIFAQNNIFDFSIIRLFLYWGFEGFNSNQKIFVEHISEKFPIKVLTGSGKLICQEIIISNVQISNSTGSGLQINLEKAGSLLIQDTKISNISTAFLDDDEDGGAFLIDASISSSVTINLKNVIAENIYCRNRGGLMYIKNGLGNTTINFQDIFIKDVFSFQGSMLYCEFSLYTKLSSQFMIDNLTIANSIEGQLRFFNKFIITTNELLVQLLFERKLFELINVKQINIRNILILQLPYESFAAISQVQYLEIQHLKINNSSLLNSFILVSSMKNQSKVSILDVQISHIQMVNEIPLQEKCTQKQMYDQIKSICNVENKQKEPPTKLMYFYNQDSIKNAYCIIEQMNKQQKKQISSLFDFSPYFTQIFIQDLHFRHINCTICQEGLINFNIYDNQSVIIINYITFYDNFCGKLSCLNVIKTISTRRILQTLIQSINTKQFDLKIQKYQCIRNFANRGTCLQIQGTTTLVKDSILKYNTAEQYGGSIYVIGHQSFFILNSVIQQNKAGFGGGLFLNDQAAQNLQKQGTIINNNIASLSGNDFIQPPSQLALSVDLEHQLPKVRIIEKDNLLVEQIDIEKYELFSNNTANTIYVPNGQILSQYQYFDWKRQVYIGYNLHLRLIPLDSLNNIQENLENTECKVSGRLLFENEEQNFTNNFTNFESVKFNQTDYNFDDLVFFLDDQLNMTLQIQFHCNSIFTPIYGNAQEIIGYHNNYFLRMNIKSLPCQLGEIKSLYDNTCVLCNATQGLYSLVVNSNTCSQKDDVTTSEIKSAQLKLKPGFWRPYFDTDQISQCINLLANCNGGWSEGDTSCFQGHIGALCEECDLFNLRGYGHFSTSSKYSCGSCVEKDKNILVITGVSLWTLISILITVRSNLALNEQMMMKRIISRLISSRVQYHSNFGILIKMITNHLQIVSAVFTFKFSSLVSVGNVINAISNPIETMTHSLDCFLKDIFDLEIHYSIMIWQVIMPFFYIIIFLCIYSLALLILKLKFSLNVITTTLIYMYIYLQPYLVGGFISLISYRQISGFIWIQANVASRYDTQTHYFWLLRFCIPLLVLIAIIIPLYFFISLYLNQNILHLKSTRIKWGYLYNEYMLGAYYWEIIKIVFKELLIIFLSFYQENVVKKGILLLALIYIYYELSLKYQPYKSYILNKLDAYSANVCCISMAVGIGIYIDQQTQTFEIQIPCLILLITLNFQYLVKIFKEIVSSFLDENAFLIDKIKETILIKVPWIQKYKGFKILLENRSSKQKRVQMRYLKLKKYLFNQAKYIIKCKNNYGIKITSTTKSTS